MACSNFIQVSANEGYWWTVGISDSKHFGVGTEAGQLAEIDTDYIQMVKIADVFDGTAFTFKSGYTLDPNVEESAYFFNIVGTDLNFMPFSSTSYMEISVFIGTSLVGTAKLRSESVPFRTYGRVVSPDTQMYQYNENSASNGQYIITRGTMLNGERKAFILVRTYNSNTLTWFCEDGRTGTFTLPTGVQDGSLGDYIAMSKLVIPGVATFDDVYFTVYRANSNSQIITVGGDTFASFQGNTSYAHLYVKCPTA